MDLPKFQQIQNSFTAHIRSPDIHPGPLDVEDRRMNIYRDLFWNNIEGLLSATFPVLKSVLRQEWVPLISAFLAQHQSTTPYFPQVPQELLRFLEAPEAQSQYAAWIWELAYYEWLELALAIDTRELPEVSRHHPPDWAAQAPLFSPLAWPQIFKYPVHQFSAQNLPTEPAADPIYIVVYRDRQLKVNFLQLNPVAARLIALMHEQAGVRRPISGRALLLSIADELKHAHPEQVVQAGGELLGDFLRRDIVLGGRALSFEPA